MGSILRFVALQVLRAAYWRSAYLRRLIGAALLLLGGGSLLVGWLEGALDRDLPGAGSVVIAASFALPNLVRTLHGRRPFLSFYGVAAVLVAAGVARAAGADVPGLGVALIAAGTWFLLALRGLRVSAVMVSARRMPPGGRPDRWSDSS